MHKAVILNCIEALNNYWAYTGFRNKRATTHTLGYIIHLHMYIIDLGVCLCIVSQKTEAPREKGSDGFVRERSIPVRDRTRQRTQAYCLSQNLLWQWQDAYDVSNVSNTSAATVPGTQTYLRVVLCVCLPDDVFITLNYGLVFACSSDSDDVVLLVKYCQIYVLFC